jgi:uncharacterized membrane protein
VQSPAAGIAIGLAAIGIGWLVYDGLCRSPAGADNRVLGLFWFVFLVWAALALDGLLSARAAYLHIGAMMGTAMVANVFFVIIPNQKKVVADLVAGRSPDPKLGAQAKQRSLHNNYMTLPVLFIMISPHYPMTYGAGRPWLVLALLGVTGVAVRHVFNLRGRGQNFGGAIAVAALLALVSAGYVTFEKGRAAGTEPAPAHFAEVQPLFARHCAACHNVPNPPKGMKLDSYAHIRAAAPRIKAMAVDTHVMPLGNATGMTDAERQRLGGWIDAGAPQ